jgi:hypothetical protein
MSRRKRNGPKPAPRTFRHLDGDPQTVAHIVNRPLADPLPGRACSSRLTWHPSGPIDFDPRDLARTIENPLNGDMQWFSDSNFFIIPTDQSVWEALLAKQDRLVLAIPVHHELQQWLMNPESNRLAADQIMLALNRSSFGRSQSAPTKVELTDRDKASIRLLDFPREDQTRCTSLEYYTNLLGMRNKAFVAISLKFAEEHGRPPTNQELSNYCKDNLGTRTQLLAKSGAEAKVPANKYNDEAMVLLALADAIHTGRETAILTRDEDVLEQYYKAMWLIDTHYRAMLLAELYQADPFAFYPVRRIVDDQRRFFDGEVLLLRKPSDELREVLPKSYTPVPVHCFFLVKEKLFQLTFIAEREMARILDVKGRTGGLSTDRFDGRNCHICLGPMTRALGNPAAIGHDVSVTLANRPWRLSILDLNLALIDGEDVSRIRTVDPRLIHIPRRPRIVTQRQTR